MGLGSLKCKRICGIWYNGAAHLGHSHDVVPCSKIFASIFGNKRGTLGSGCCEAFWKV